jgi:hypothetical protein
MSGRFLVLGQAASNEGAQFVNRNQAPAPNSEGLNFTIAQKVEDQHTPDAQEFRGVVRAYGNSI